MSELPTGWALGTLGDIVTEVRNGISAKPDQKAGLPILRISAVRPMRLDASDTRYLPQDFEGAEVYRLAQDDLLFTRYNGNRELVGVCARIRDFPQRMVYPDKLIRVRLNRALAHPAFVEYAVHSSAARQFISEKLKSSAGQIGISGADLKRLPIPIAPLSEQKRIADKLDRLLAAVDSCKARLDAIPAILKRFRQSVLAAATSGELTEEWRLENNEQDAWRSLCLGELARDIRYGTAKKCSYEQSGTAVLRIPNVGDGQIDLADLKFATFDAAERERLALDPGDLLVIRSNGSADLVGKVAVVTEREAGMLYAGYLIRVRIDRTVVAPAFLALALSAPAVRSYIEVRARSTSGVHNINSKELARIELPIPTLPEQREIVALVARHFDLAKQVEATLSSARSRTEKLTQGVLTKAFLGELIPRAGWHVDGRSA